ncbi:MAG: helix-hairpin-helix domain-containing protein [Chitinophagaceae bacterium]
MGTLFLPAFLSNNSSDKYETPDSSWITIIRKLEVQQDTGAKSFRAAINNKDNPHSYIYDAPAEGPKKGRLFDFDPNTLSVEGWKELGLRENTIRIIQNYLSKGGHFRKPEDLQRVYGLHADEYERLLPFIKIEAASPAQNNSYTAEPGPPRTKGFHLSAFEINEADTSAFIALPGIGSKLAMRIVSFREKLGGFYSIDQVGEVYGLADSVFQKIKSYLKCDEGLIQKININTATVDQLKVHPYIKYAIANSIIAYRNEHGLFLKIEDIKRVMVITDEVYEKIRLYLSVTSL